MSAATPPKTSLREATPDDLDDVVQLLSARDGMARNREVVRDYLWGLEPEHFRGWLAYADDRPVGLTSVYLRDMQWPQENGSPQTKRAGYWSHLYVEPEFRKQMIYPQLVLSMLRSMKTVGLDIIFTATRQPDVAEGHQKLGFKLVGKLPLRLRPLRPFRLLAKHKGAGVLAPACGPFDALYRLAAGRRIDSSSKIEEVGLESPVVDEIVALLNAAPSTAVHQQWDADLFRRRFRRTLDGTDYRITIIKKNDSVLAALMMAIADRGNNIRAGIVLDFVAQPTATREELDALLGEGEQYAHRQGAEVMLSLEHSLMLEAWGSSHTGYLETSAETYHMLVYPKTIAESPNLAAELENWRFSFADHDAF